MEARLASKGVSAAGAAAAYALGLERKTISPGERSENFVASRRADRRAWWTGRETASPPRPHEILLRFCRGVLQER